MDPSKRNATALHQRVDDICDQFQEHFSSILGATMKDLEGDNSATAHNELTIIQESNSLVKSAQNLTVLIRDLQELWLFGGLDTLMDLGDEEANKAKVLNIAAMVETLAKLNLPKIEKKTLEQGQAEERPATEGNDDDALPQPTAALNDDSEFALPPPALLSEDEFFRSLTTLFEEDDTVNFLA